MWFLTAGPVINLPMILAELPDRKNCGCFFKKHHRHEQVQVFDIYLGVFSCLHLAVGRHHRRRIPRHPHGLQLGRVKVFIAHHMHTLAPESATNSLPSCFIVDAAGKLHSSVGEKNVALSFSLRLYMFLARFHALPRAHRCCLSVSSCPQISQRGYFADEAF